MVQRLARIERVGEAVPASCLRHELGDARGAFWAHSAGIEAALLPDDASEKFDGQAVLRRGLLQRPANVICRRWIGGRVLRFDRHSRLFGLLMHRYWRGGARLRVRLRA